MWIPNNPHAAAAGLTDSRAEALAYLESLSLGMIDPTLAAALIDTGPELVRWLEETTPLRLQVIEGYPDYHLEHPRWEAWRGPVLDPGLFDFVELGPWADRVAPAAEHPKADASGDSARRWIRHDRSGGPRRA